MLVLLTWATDGVFPLAVVVAAAGYGAWPARWLTPRATRGQMAVLAAALGLGVLGLATLALGLTGALTQISAAALIVGGVALGCAAIARKPALDEKSQGATGQPIGRESLVRAGRPDHPSLSHRAVGERSSESPDPAPSGRGAGLRIALLSVGLAIPALVAAAGATLPPGVLWIEEGRGYDVLEYHLQAPREWYEAGRITFLPHNVYASFPQQMESLYLLLMALRGDAHAAAIPAQMLHLMCGALALLAIGVWSKPGWPRVAAVLAASAPWLVIVGVLAYVELGMLLFAAVAAGLLLSQLRMNRPDRGAMFAAGLAAGLAGGCKYTAIVLVAIAGWIAWMALSRAAWRARVAPGAIFALGAALAFAPWAARNLAFTGDPVYPFGWRVFHGAAWSDEQAAQWDRGHRVQPEHTGFAGRAKLAARELFGHFAVVDAADAATGFRASHFGVGIWIVPLLALGVGWRSREAACCAIWFGILLLAWIALTHMPGRFAIPAIAPLALFVGRGASDRVVPRWSGPIVAGVALIASLLGGWQITRQFGAETRSWADAVGVDSALQFAGDVEAFLSPEAQPLNALPADAYVWIIGGATPFYTLTKNHYTVVFSRDPWLEFAQTADADAAVAWLRERGVTHVQFAWSEITRLRRTYGFAELVTPDWAAQLAAAGMTVVLETPGGTLFEVEPK